MFAVGHTYVHFNVLLFLNMYVNWNALVLYILTKVRYGNVLLKITGNQILEEKKVSEL